MQPLRHGLLAIVCLAVASCSPSPPPAADLILTNGRIWTGDAALAEARALAVTGERVTALGSSESVAAARGPATRVIDLNGRLVVPGFNDAHWHLPARRSAELAEAGAVDEIQRRLVEFSKTLGPADWVMGRGWGPSDFPALRPHRRYLDEVLPGRAVVLTDRDGHQLLVSTEALTRAEVTRASIDPANGRIVRDENGEPTGVLQESAMSLVRNLVPPLTTEQVYAALMSELDKAAAFGLTSLQVASGTHPGSIEFEAYTRALERKTLKARLRVAVPFEKDITEARLAEFVALRDRHPDGLLTFGIAKGMLDGTVDAHTAAMLEPYTGLQDSGLPMWSDEELRRSVAAYDKAGLQVQLHAVGDKAIRMALDAFEHAARVNQTTGRRHRVEHAEVPSVEDLPRFKALGVVASTQAMFASPDAITLTSFAPALGPTRAPRADAFKLFDTAGAVQAFGSDYPVFTMQVMRGIHTAVTRQLPDGTPPGGWYPEHRLTVEAAVRHFTRDAAYASFGEANAGTLTVGRLADFTVLSDDIFAIDPARLASVKVLLTVMGGRETWRAADW